MRHPHRPRRPRKPRANGLLVVLALATSPCDAVDWPPGSRILYETGFEPFEGFSPDFDLAGQGGWIGFATDLGANTVALGGNGLMAGPIDGFSGQAAYIGFNAPTATADFNLWHPVNLMPAGDLFPLVRFTVSFQIEASSEGQIPDAFRWSVYNTAEKRLFSIDFDNASREIGAILDDGTAGQAPAVRPSGFLFRNGEPYDLELSLNFQRNVWAASINGHEVFQGLPITTKNSALNLGDVDAVWLIRTPGQAGDNFMIFDDYRLVAVPLEELPPALEPIGFVQPGGAFVVRVAGEPGVTYQLQVLDAGEWQPVAQGIAQSPDGHVDLEDTTAGDWMDGIYRAVSIPAISP